MYLNCKITLLVFKLSTTYRQYISMKESPGGWPRPPAFGLRVRGGAAAGAERWLIPGVLSR